MNSIIRSWSQSKILILAFLLTVFSISLQVTRHSKPSCQILYTLTAVIVYNGTLTWSARGSPFNLDQFSESAPSGTREPEQKILYFLFQFPCLSLLVSIEAAYGSESGVNTSSPFVFERLQSAFEAA